MTINKLSNQAEFFIFLLEKYAEAKSISASEVLNMWKSLDIVDYINDMYEQYHTERIENAFEDIDRKITISRK